MKNTSFIYGTIFGATLAVVISLILRDSSNREEEVFVSQVAQTKILEWAQFSSYPSGVEFTEFHTNRSDSEAFFLKFEGNPTRTTQWVESNIQSIKLKYPNQVMITPLFDGTKVYTFPSIGGKDTINLSLAPERGVVVIQAVEGIHS